jgi:flavin reductase (DIM6/NTAB) family NADH-FMN oxidoreductase RutF
MTPFEDVFRKIPYPVTVVTVGLGGAENGLAVSWLSQVSFEPPMLLFSIHRDHYSVEHLRSTPHFVVNLLGEEQQDVAAHFAKASMVGKDKLSKFKTRPAKSEVPILTDAVAYFDCAVAETIPAGDHLLVLGRVEDAGVLRNAAVLTSASGLRYR